jgi:hypothetical protein
MLLGTKIIEPQQLKLDVFTQEATCQQLNTNMEERQVGASRVYALFLLIKKILVYLASSESVRRSQYIAPNTWNSWTCVDTICSDSNTARKQISRNRKILGVEQSKKQQAPARSVLTIEDLKMPTLYGEKKKPAAAAKSGPATTAIAHAPAAAPTFRSNAEHQPIAVASSKPADAAVAAGATGDPNELKPQELKQITKGCLEWLGRSTSVREGGHFGAYLVVATLCLGMAPRQQVLRQLQLGSSFLKKEDGRYWVVMLAHMNKNGKATTFPLASELTQAYDLYLAKVRPLLLGTRCHEYVFCKRTGDAPGPTFDFSDWTRSVCKELIGRPVNCHAFRSAVVTTYYKTGATQNEMNALADVVSKPFATKPCKRYFRPRRARRWLQLILVCTSVGSADGS